MGTVCGSPPALLGFMTALKSASRSVSESPRTCTIWCPTGGCDAGTVEPGCWIGSMAGRCLFARGPRAHKHQISARRSACSGSGAAARVALHPRARPPILPADTPTLFPHCSATKTSDPNFCFVRCSRSAPSGRSLGWGMGAALCLSSPCSRWGGWDLTHRDAESFPRIEPTLYSGSKKYKGKKRNCYFVICPSLNIKSFLESPQTFSSVTSWAPVTLRRRSLARFAGRGAAGQGKQGML